MKTFPVLFKRSVNGTPQQWQIHVKGDSYWTVSGQVGGALVTSEPTVCEPKNIGRANATTPEAQALAEAASKHQKKLDKGYAESIEAVDNSDGFFKCQLAKKFVDYKDSVTYPLLGSPKLDGLRMICTKRGIITRNGKPFVSTPHIHEALKPLFAEHPSWVIDGEIYSHDVQFEKIVSLTRKKDPTPEELDESKKICQLWIFDGVVDDKKMGFQKRFALIKAEIARLVKDAGSLRFVENTPIANAAEVETLHESFVSKGYEGLMVRVPDSPYENKRSKNLLKYKHFQDEEFELVEVEEGIGNRSGMAGQFLLKMKDGRTFRSNMRGGMEYYKKLLKEKDSLVGKMVTVRFQEYTQGGVFVGIPRFPVAVAIRDYE
jgi:DNA ligase 1